MKASTETITVRAAFSPRLSAALIRLESDLTFIEMEARMHYHNRRSWDLDLEFQYGRVTIEPSSHVCRFGFSA